MLQTVGILVAATVVTNLAWDGFISPMQLSLYTIETHEIFPVIFAVAVLLLLCC